MNKRKSSRETGKQYEGFAEVFLKKKGYRIIQKNYTTPYGEADLIALDGQTTVFVEVKSAAGQDPIESVTETKVRRIRNAALYYMQGIGCEIAIRFDVITIIKGSNNNTEVRHMIDAF